MKQLTVTLLRRVARMEEASALSIVTSKSSARVTSRPSSLPYRSIVSTGLNVILTRGVSHSLSLSLEVKIHSILFSIVVPRGKKVSSVYDGLFFFSLSSFLHERVVSYVEFGQRR